MSDDTTFMVGEAIDALRRAQYVEKKMQCLQNDFQRYRASSQLQIQQNILLREKVYALSARVAELERVREAALQYLQAKTVEGAQYALNALKEAKP